MLGHTEEEMSRHEEEMSRLANEREAILQMMRENGFEVNDVNRKRKSSSDNGTESQLQEDERPSPQKKART